MNDNDGVYVLPANFTIEVVEDIRKDFIELLLTGEREIRCGGSAVTNIDTSGIQLLVSLYKAGARERKKILIINPSPELQEVFALTGIHKVFTVEEVC